MLGFHTVPYHELVQTTSVKKIRVSETAVEWTAGRTLVQQRTDQTFENQALMFLIGIANVAVIGSCQLSGNSGKLR